MSKPQAKVFAGRSDWWVWEEHRKVDARGIVIERKGVEWFPFLIEVEGNGATTDPTVRVFDGQKWLRIRSGRHYDRELFHRGGERNGKS